MHRLVRCIANRGNRRKIKGVRGGKKMKEFKQKREDLLYKKQKKNNYYIQQYIIKPDLALASLGRSDEENPPVELLQMCIAYKTQDASLLVYKGMGQEAMVCDGSSIYTLEGYYELIIDKRISDEEKLLFSNSEGLERFLSKEQLKGFSPSFLQLLMLSKDSFTINSFISETSVSFVDYQYKNIDYINSSLSLHYGMLAQIFPSASKLLLSQFQE